MVSSRGYLCISPSTAQHEPHNNLRQIEQGQRHYRMGQETIRATRNTKLRKSARILSSSTDHNNAPVTPMKGMTFEEVDETNNFSKERSCLSEGKALLERRRSSRGETSFKGTSPIDMIKTPEQKSFGPKKRKRKSFTGSNIEMDSTAIHIKEKFSECLPSISSLPIIHHKESKRSSNENDESSEAITPTTYSGEFTIRPPSVKLQHREAKKRKTIELRRRQPTPSCVRSLFSSTSHNVMPTLEELKALVKKTGVMRD